MAMFLSVAAALLLTVAGHTMSELAATSGEPHLGDEPSRIDSMSKGGLEVRCEGAATEVPEFGGAFLTETGGERVLQVWVTKSDGPNTEAILQALRASCPEHARVVFREARYSYAQLRSWGLELHSAPGVTRTGVDESTNRLTVGVDDLDRRRPAILARVDELGVPAEAVVLVEFAPAELLQPADQPATSTGPGVVVGAVAGLVGAVVVATAVWVRRRGVGRA